MGYPGAGNRLRPRDQDKRNGEPPEREGIVSRLLMVITGADHLTLKDGTNRPTGFWAEEVVVPHEKFREAGVAVELATPGGVEAPLDPKSLAPEMNPNGPQVIKHYLGYLA